MTIAKQFASKLAVAFVASAMIFIAIAPSAKAETTEDLQKMINDLLAQVAALKGDTKGEMKGDTKMSASCTTFARDLKTGATGADVKELQMFLNKDADTRVAATGAGSAGMETMTYGPATAAAVSKLQVKYRAEILSPSGLVNPTGFFGPSTRAHVNKMCAGGSTDGDSDGDDTDGGDSSELSGEGTLDKYEMEDASDDEVQEGAEYAEIAEITVEATDGDIEIDRMTFELNDGSVANSESDPWEVFETISLWVDGDMVAEFDASDEDEYLDEDNGEFRFSGLGLVAMEDEELDIVVAATVVSSVDDAGSATLADWELTTTAVRYFDADDVSEDEDDLDGIGLINTAGADEATFRVVEAGDDEELKFSLGDNNPDSTDILADTDDTTDGVTILEYNIEAKEGDIELNTLYVDIATVGNNSNVVIDDVTIDIEGDTFDAENSPSSTTTVTRFEFDVDGDVTIDSEDEVTVKVMVDLRSQEVSNTVPRYSNGSTIKATAVVDSTDAEGADDVNDLTGSAVGDTHTIVAEGIVVPVDGFSSTIDTLGQNDTIGEYTLEFEVTAVEGDFYIKDFASTTATAASGGIEFALDPVAAGSITASLDSTADEDTATVFTVEEGETETFTLTVTFDPVAAGSFRVQLEEIYYSTNTNGVTGSVLYTPTPAQDFRSASKAINI
jgi:hypothetical protein